VNKKAATVQGRVPDIAEDERKFFVPNKDFSACYSQNGGLFA
jgi:hypothetical protein